MKRYYKITIRTRDIFNFTTAVVVKQYDPNPLILAAYNSEDGQLVDLRIHCTYNEKVIISVALKDYILRMVPVTASGRDLTFMERLALWT